MQTADRERSVEVRSGPSTASGTVVEGSCRQPSPWRRPDVPSGAQTGRVVADSAGVVVLDSSVVRILAVVDPVELLVVLAGGIGLDDRDVHTVGESVDVGVVGITVVDDASVAQCD